MPYWVICTAQGRYRESWWRKTGAATVARLRLALALDRQMRASQTKTVQTSNRTFFRSRFRFSAKSETESGQCQPKEAHRTCVKTAVEGQGWLRYGGHGAAAEQGFCGILHLKLVTTAPTQPSQPTATLASGLWHRKLRNSCAWQRVTNAYAPPSEPLLLVPTVPRPRLLLSTHSVSLPALRRARR